MQDGNPLMNVATNPNPERQEPDECDPDPVELLGSKKITYKVTRLKGIIQTLLRLNCAGAM